MQTNSNSSDIWQLVLSILVFVIIIGVIIVVIKKISLTSHQYGQPVPDHEIAQLSPVKSVSQDYHYERRDLVMTRAETEFFKMLDAAIGQNYYVFPQVHLSSILEHRVKGQDWWKAFHHINRKSVDFVICDRQSIRPLAAIELDDWSHRLDKRKTRDTEVERIFQGANFPLLRFGHKGPYTTQAIARSIAETGVLNS
jgi:hypothetical protein